MKPKDLLVELEIAAQSFDVKVSYESIASMVVRGGLCKVKGQYRIIIDKRLTLEERATTLAKALARFDSSNLSDLDPATMSLLQYYCARLQRLKSPGPNATGAATMARSTKQSSVASAAVAKPVAPVDANRKHPSVKTDAVA